MASTTRSAGCFGWRYGFTDPSAGFLWAWGTPTHLVRAACRALAQALAQVEERHLSAKVSGSAASERPRWALLVEVSVAWMTRRAIATIPGCVSR